MGFMYSNVLIEVEDNGLDGVAVLYRGLRMGLDSFKCRWVLVSGVTCDLEKLCRNGYLLPSWSRLDIRSCVPDMYPSMGRI